MTFLHPALAAAAVAAIGIPILIHLLMRRRRKPVMWGAMRFLLEAYKHQRRRLRLEQFLLLAARCLVILLAGLAIARPLMGSGGLLGGRGPVTLYLLVDNGLAASAQGADGESALARHKARAGALLAELDPASGDRAALIALGGPARAVVVPPSSGLTGVAELVREMETTDSASDLSGALATVRSAQEAEARGAGTVGGAGGRTVVAVLSDFLAGSADTERKLAELMNLTGAGGQATLMATQPAETGVSNVSIVGLEPLRSVVLVPRAGEGGATLPAPVRVMLRRSGPAVGQGGVTTVRFAVGADGSGRGPMTRAGEVRVEWAPGESEKAASHSIDIGAVAGTLDGSGSAVLAATIDRDAIEGDNTWRRPIELRRTIRVGVAAPRRLGAARPGLEQYQPADWVRLALQPESSAAAHAEAEVDVTEIEPGSLDPARLAGIDVLIVASPELLPEGAWRRVRAFADAGGLVVVMPAAGATVHLWADAMVRDMGLPWSVAREARAYSPPANVAAERGAESGARGSGLLSVLDAELADLAMPIRVSKVLPVEAVQGAPALFAPLRLGDGAPLLIASEPGRREEASNGEASGRGLVVFLASALSFEWTDLQAKPLIVPLLQEVVRQGVGQARGANVALAGAVPDAPVRAVELRAAETGRGIAVSQGRAAEAVRDAGIWRAVDDQGALRGIVAVNADPAGGRGESQPRSVVGAWLSAAAGSREVRWIQAESAAGVERDGGREGKGGGGMIRSSMDQGDTLGRLALPLLVAALALAVIELFLARWFSHAYVHGRGGEAAAA